MKTFYSQQAEDIFVFDRYINKITSDGIFVELGAVDGIKYSNTKFFEDNLNFRGVLIEPTNQYKNLVINRPNCLCYNEAVSMYEGKIKFLGDNATAGISEKMNDTFKNTWHKNSSEYYVNCKPFKDILKNAKIEYIDLLSIDVEGGELIVLETFDFNIPVYLIVIELDGHNIDKDDKCRNILKNNGFILDKKITINEFWINKNYYRVDKLYDESINKLDFSNILNLGNFVYIEKGLIPQIENEICNCNN